VVESHHIDGIRVMNDGVMTPFIRWTGAVVLAGVGQVLTGSLAYLLPVLNGSSDAPKLREHS
jgi:hypothetical protein